MRLGSLLWNGNPAVGLVCDDQVLILNGMAECAPSQYGPLLAATDVMPLWAAETRGMILAIDAQCRTNGILPEWKSFTLSLDSCTWLPPVRAPQKIICIGLNYKDHAEESRMQPPQEPVLFSKFNNTLIGASGPVILPSNSVKVDYEAELAFVIGRYGRRIREEEALSYVGGYFILNDVSARDWQFRSSQWLCGKTFDTFAPCGPYLVTPDEIPDPHNLGIRLTLNGQIMQDSNTRNLLFGIPALIGHISSIMTLNPGDIVSTGTPAGVGFARKPPVYLQDGDVVEASIEGIGSICHRFIAESSQGL